MVLDVQEADVRQAAQKANTAGQILSNQQKQNFIDDSVPLRMDIAAIDALGTPDEVRTFASDEDYKSPQARQMLQQHQTQRIAMLTGTELEKTKAVALANEVKYQAMRSSDAEKLRADGFGNPFSYDEDGLLEMNNFGLPKINDAKFDEAAKAKAEAVARKRTGSTPAIVASMDHATQLRSTAADLMDTNPEQAQSFLDQADILEKWAEKQTQFAPKQLVDTDTKKSIKYDPATGKPIVETTTRTQRPVNASNPAASAKPSGAKPFDMRSGTKYEDIPSGSVFTDPEGVKRRKP
jgi:hypothetical protein